MDIKKLKLYLDKFLSEYDSKSRIKHDPVLFIHLFKEPKDIEVAGIIASSLAYGKVEGILKAVGEVLGMMDGSPYNFVLNFDPFKERIKFKKFKYRLWKEIDISCLLYSISELVKKYGSIENAFLDGYNEKDEDIGNALIKFVDKALSIDWSCFYPAGNLHPKAGVRNFFPSPLNGSACKRLNLYLRWMVRKNGVDKGIWKNILKSKLIIPLDTHIARICRYIGLTELKTPGWKMALDITRTLRNLDPDDPVKYDFALCHLGISGNCPKIKDIKKCCNCRIKDICNL